MTTHALRYHGKFLGHVTPEEAGSLVEQHVAEGASEHDFDVHPRQSVELLVRGNLIDTFDTEEEAAAACDHLLHEENAAHPRAAQITDYEIVRASEPDPEPAPEPEFETPEDVAVADVVDPTETFR